MLKQPLLERYSKKWKYQYSISFHKWNILTGTTSSHRSSLQAAMLRLSSLASSSISCSHPCCWWSLHVWENEWGSSQYPSQTPVPCEHHQHLVSITSTSPRLFLTPNWTLKQAMYLWMRADFQGVLFSYSYTSASFLMLSKGIPTRTGQSLLLSPCYKLF